jgi:hypothetical protein
MSVSGPDMQPAIGIDFGVKRRGISGPGRCRAYIREATPLEARQNGAGDRIRGQRAAGQSRK